MEEDEIKKLTPEDRIKALKNKEKQKEEELKKLKEKEEAEKKEIDKLKKIIDETEKEDQEETVRKGKQKEEEEKKKAEEKSLEETVKDEKVKTKEEDPNQIDFRRKFYEMANENVYNGLKELREKSQERGYLSPDDQKRFDSYKQGMEGIVNNSNYIQNEEVKESINRNQYALNQISTYSSNSHEERDRKRRMM